jgi:hypothetical protein
MVNIVLKWVAIFCALLVGWGLLGIIYQGWQSRQIAKRQADLPKVERPAIVSREDKCEKSISSIF